MKNAHNALKKFDTVAVETNKRLEMRRTRRIHFVGIGGVGMSGIAEVLLTQGYSVTGSDLNESAFTDRLKRLGAEIKLGHDEAHVQQADVVVVSSAIDPQNVEFIAARKLRIPIVPRAEMLAELMRFRYGIAVAGTHGKTTTTSLMASVLNEAGLDPTFVIGGRLESLGANARLGASQYLVAEADESDASFLHLNPMVTIVTNIDADHLATYGGDFNRLQKVFVEFLHHLPFYGLAVLCIECPIISALLPEISRPILTYGFSEQADFRAINFKQTGTSTQFDVLRPNRQPLTITLNLPGRHNVLNALAAIVVATEEGVDDVSICKALQQFSGVGRRFQLLGELCLPEGGKVTLVDDYGHHPQEIQATIEAARLAWPDRRLAMLFQPHRYTRTQDLFEDFCKALSDVDVLLLLEVYPAGEKPIVGADSRSLCRAIRARNCVEPIYIDSLEELPTLLPHILEANDVLFAQGAGTISQIAHGLIEKFKQAN